MILRHLHFYRNKYPVQYQQNAKIEFFNCSEIGHIISASRTWGVSHIDSSISHIANRVTVQQWQKPMHPSI
jgi:hypothetical protein